MLAPAGRIGGHYGNTHLPQQLPGSALLQRQSVGSPVCCVAFCLTLFSPLPLLVSWPPLTRTTRMCTSSRTVALARTSLACSWLTSCSIRARVSPLQRLVNGRVPSSRHLTSLSASPQPYLILGWTFTLLATLGVILLMLPANQGNIPSPAYAAVYSATSRLVWSLGLSWITFVSLHNYGGLVSAFLCAKVWVPLSRLTYCAYLVHPIIIAIFYGSRHQTFDYSFYLIVSAPSLPLLSTLVLTAMPLFSPRSSTLPSATSASLTWCHSWWLSSWSTPLSP